MSNMSIGRFGEDFAARLREFAPEAKQPLAQGNPGSTSSSKSFADHLWDGVKEVDAMQKTTDKMATDLATGKAENIHEVMVATTEAQLAFNLMVQVRNKVLEAYQEVMRMPV
jgi:flagellar hook-basal body complex protein FliE